MQFEPDDNYKKSEKFIKKMDALRQGVDALRNQTYLPILEREETSSYNTRVSQTILTNYTEKTVNAAKGMIFRKPLAYENLKINDTDVDTEGQTLNRFAQDVTESGLWYGHSIIMVDSPSMEGINTLADEKAAGIVPYMTLVERKNVISYDYTYINGKAVLTEIVIEEAATGDNERQVRKLFIGGGEIWSKKKDEEDFTMDKEWKNTLPYIPVATFYTRRTGFMQSKPMFDNVADLNIRHFSEDSMSWRIKAYAGNPILKIWGQTQDMEDGQGITMSVNSAMLFNDKESGDAAWLVYEGKELELFERSMSNIEQKIAMLGLSMLSSKQETKELTATEKNIDSAQENSDLASIAMNLEDALNDAYAMVLDMSGKTKGDESISVNKEFVKEMLTSLEVAELRTQYLSGLIDKEYFWTLMEEGGWFKSLNRELLRANITDGEPTFATS